MESDDKDTPQPKPLMLYVLKVTKHEHESIARMIESGMPISLSDEDRMAWIVKHIPYVVPWIPETTPCEVALRIVGGDEKWLTFEYPRVESVTPVTPVTPVDDID